MKPLLVLGKIFFIGCLWSLFFIEGMRTILLINWHFDLFWPAHWEYLWALWHNGWVISHPKEWAFVLLLLAVIPMWLTGWIFLSVINWHNIFTVFILIPFRKLREILSDIRSPLHNNLALQKVIKKKSYKEIRPNIRNGQTSAITDTSENKSTFSQVFTTPEPVAISANTQTAPITTKAPAQIRRKTNDIEENKPFTHSVFDFDDDDDDFDLDFDNAINAISKRKNIKQDYYTNNDDEEYDNDDYQTDSSNFKNFDMEEFDNYDEDDEYEDTSQRRRKNNKDRNSKRREPAPKQDYREDRRSRQDTRKNNTRQQHNDTSNPIVATLQQKGYEVITGTTIKNIFVDYIAISREEIYLCLVDKEIGDWLADEDRFNDEEPLWFSESSHRISPVRMACIARDELERKLDENNLNYAVQTFVIIQNGNIINAEDMFEIWKNLDINVTRINRGTPKEIPLFSKSVLEAESSIDNRHFDAIKKFIRNIK